MKISQELLQDLRTHIYFSERLKLKNLNVNANECILYSPNIFSVLSNCTQVLF